MSRRNILALVGVVGVALTIFVFANWTPRCATDDRACLMRVAKGHKVRTAGFWKDALSKAPAVRIGPAPDALVEYLRLDNLVNGFQEVPVASTLSPEFLADVRAAMAEIPAPVRRLLDDSFAGVWFVDRLGGSGFTDMYFGADGKPAGSYVVLDASAVGKRAANAWATWKERTPFRPQDEWTLQAKIEEPAGDDRRGALRYILLHELGHVISVRRDFHPRWDLEPRDVPADARYPFFDLSWVVNRTSSRYESKYDAWLPKRESVVYYRVPRLAADRMVPIYGALESTNFPTLYAATSPGDDFADSFASYVHTVLMKRPWEITIARDGRVVKTFRSCWDEARCADKRRILDNLLR